MRVADKIEQLQALKSAVLLSKEFVKKLPKFDFPAVTNLISMAIVFIAIIVLVLPPSKDDNLFSTEKMLSSEANMVVPIRIGDTLLAREMRKASLKTNSLSGIDNLDRRYDTRNDWLHERMKSSYSWLSSANQNYYTIQLLLAKSSDELSLRAFLRDQLALPADQQTNNTNSSENDIYIYKAGKHLTGSIGVLVGTYEDYTSARDALVSLDSNLKKFQPFIRQLKDVSAIP